MAKKKRAERGTGVLMVDVQEVPKMLGLSDTAVLRLMEKGELRWKKFEGKRRRVVLVEDIERVARKVKKGGK